MKRPKLRADLSIVEQNYRGEQSFVVKERLGGKYFRFKLLEILVMQQLDGEQTYPQIAAALAEQGLPFKPAQVEGFARKLDGMGLLEKSVAEKSVLQMERLRAERNRRVKKTHYQGSILRMRWSVGDPDEFLNQWLPRLGFFFSRPFIVISILLFATYAAVVFGKHDEFLFELRRFYTPSTWTLGWFVTFYVTACVVIVIHEFGHAFTCKYFGGEVHEMGAMLIYGQPAFYCNVNDAWTFPELKSRLWVTAAGSWIQMATAGIAALVWWAAEPGTLVSQVSLIAVLIGGIMTCFANANPLIPLDGYYALSDWLEIPNMRGRAFKYVGYLLKRYLLRLSVPEPEADEREKRIFLFYGVLALAYIFFILTLLAGRLYGWMYRTLGAIGAILFAMFLWSVLKRRARGLVVNLTTAVRERRGMFRSPRFMRRAALVVAVVLLAGLLVPWPIHVLGTFTASAPETFTLTAPDDAVVARVVAREGTRLPAGSPVVVLRNPDREREAIALAWRVDSLSARAQRARAEGEAAETRRLEAALSGAAASLAALRARLDLYTLRAPVAAVVATPRLEESLGRGVEAGDTIVVLLAGGDSVELRVALERAGATLVRPGQPAGLVPLSDVGAAARAPVVTVATAGGGEAGPDQPLEARVRLPAGPAWRPGITGEAYITVRRSNLFGALWWGVRKRIRSDLLM